MVFHIVKKELGRKERILIYYISMHDSILSIKLKTIKQFKYDFLEYVNINKNYNNIN